MELRMKAGQIFQSPQSSRLDSIHPTAIRHRPDRQDAAATAVHSAPTRFGPHKRASVRSCCP